jgi:hypothetical protein
MMFTKPFTRQTITTPDLSKDMSAIRRLLTAAAISPRFCAGLLHNPGAAVQSGFGGEQFQISESTMGLLTSIQVSSLPDFIQQLDTNLSNKLLAAEVIRNNM